LTTFQSNASSQGTPPGAIGSMNRMQMSAIQPIASGSIHLYRSPRCHAPRSKESPFRQRRKTGIPNAMYKPITAIEVPTR
jgi:hypothetical protein